MTHLCNHTTIGNSSGGAPISITGHCICTLLTTFLSTIFIQQATTVNEWPQRSLMGNRSSIQSMSISVVFYKTCTLPAGGRRWRHGLIKVSWARQAMWFDSGAQWMWCDENDAAAKSHTKAHERWNGWRCGPPVVECRQAARAIHSN